MRLSQFFLPCLKDNPNDATVISHTLMIRAGMIRQVASGIYSWLPLGKIVLDNVMNIIRHHLNSVGCIELLMPCIQPAHLWEESGRYEDYGKEMLRIKDRHENNMLFGPTAEEMITDIFRHTIRSHKELPKIFYQIQTKFRDEIRPRFGVMRGREFIMKDAYSFDLTPQLATKTYKLIYNTYCKIFCSMGLTAIPVRADTGPIGGDLSHEFHILADTGESTLYYDKTIDSIDPSTLDFDTQLYAAAEEKHNPQVCQNIDLKVRHGIEVGHIFYFGTKYSTSMKAMVESGNGITPVEMGSYGIGVSRLVAAIIEVYHDKNGICWPEAVAPFHIVVINLSPKNEACNNISQMLYNSCVENKYSVLLDDTNNSIGEKLATMDLIGIPWQIIIGIKNANISKVEIKNRKTGVIETLDYDHVINKIAHKAI